MPLAHKVLEKMTYVKTREKIVKSVNNTKYAKTQFDGETDLYSSYSSRCMHGSSFMAVALIVVEKMT